MPATQTRGPHDGETQFRTTLVTETGGGEPRVQGTAAPLAAAWKKIIKDLGTRVGVDTLHPHAFRHACAVELLKRSGGNLRAVQEHLRHANIGCHDGCTTTMAGARRVGTTLLQKRGNITVTVPRASFRGA